MWKASCSFYRVKQNAVYSRWQECRRETTEVTWRPRQKFCSNAKLVMCYCVALEVQTCRYINVPPAPPCEVHVVPRITCISSAWQVIFGKSLGMFLSFSQSSEYFVEAKVLQKGRSNRGLGEDYMKYIWETDGKNAKTRQEEDGSNRNGCPKLFTNPLCVKRIIKYKFWKVNITRTEFFFNCQDRSH